MSAGDGRAALAALRRLQRRAWARHAVATMKRPRNVALLIFGAGILALFIAPQFLYGGTGGVFAGDTGVKFVGAGLVLLTALTTVAGIRNGAIYFKPPEVQFLLPAPVTSRELVEHHLVANTIRSALSVVVFAVFLRLRDASLWRVLLGYALAFVLMTIIQTKIDLAHAHLVPSARRARGRRWSIGLSLLAGLLIGIPWLADGRALSVDVLRWLALPAWPATAVMTGSVADAALGAALLVGASWWLWRSALRDPPDVREGALRMSEYLASVIDNARRGRTPLDGKAEEARSTTLRRVPHLRGAGVFAWRQIVSLRRSRGAFGMLLYMTIVAAVVSGIVADENRAVGIACATLAVLTSVGPMYVRCDFRGDTEVYAYLRSLPVSPTTMAWGQLLPSALVIAALQWIAAGWGLALLPFEWWPAALLALLALPLVNLWQLTVWNGAHLVAPAKLIDESGTPSATQLAKSSLVMIVLMLVMAATAVPAGLAGLAGWLAATEWLGTTQAVAAIPTVLAAGGVLGVEVAVLVMFVGQLFARAEV